MREAILKNFTDPNWWFTVVIVSLVIGVVSSFIKDGIYWFFAHFSKKVSFWKEKRDQKRDRRICILSENPYVLIIEFILFIWYTIMFSVLVSSALLIYSQVRDASSAEALNKPFLLLLNLFMCFLLFMAVFYEFLMFETMIVCLKARRSYRDSIEKKSAKDTNSRDGHIVTSKTRKNSKIK